MAASLPLILAGSAALAGGLGAWGSYQQGQSAAAAAGYNAEVQRPNAREAAAAGAAQVAELHRQGRQALAEQRAGALEAGGLAGSALDLYRQSAEALEADAAVASRDVELQSRGLLQDARLRGWQAGKAGRAARHGLLTGMLGVGVAGGTSYYSLKAPGSHPGPGFGRLGAPG